MPSRHLITGSFLLAIVAVIIPPASSQSEYSSIETNKKDIGYPTQNDLRDDVMNLIDARNWDKLEDLATRYRDEGLTFANGNSAYYTLFQSVDNFRAMKDEGRFSRLLTNIDLWKEYRPESYFPDLMKAHAYYERGWRFRGSGYASTVSEEGWTGFYENLGHATTIYEALYDADIQDTVLYGQLIALAKCGEKSRRSANEYFDGAMAANPGNFDACTAMVSMLHPKWGGSFLQLRRFAESTAKDHGEQFYFLIAAYIRLCNGWEDFGACKFDYARLKTCFETIPENHKDYPRHLVSFAYFACHERDQAVALETMQKIEAMGCVGWWNTSWGFQQWMAWAKGESDPPARTRLHTAAEHANFPEARALLDEGADIDAIDNLNYTPILLAIKNGKHAMAMLLLERGANPSLAPNGGWGPLHMAVDRGKPELIEALLEAGASPMQKDGQGWTPLHVAARNETPDALEILLKQPGIDADARTGDSEMTALLAATGYAREECAMLLIEDGRFDPTVADNTRYTPLHHAAQRALPKVVDALLQDGRVDVNAISRRAATPLIAAVFHRNAGVVKKLLAAPGIDVNHESRMSGTALHYALYNNDRGMSYILLTDPRVDVNIRSKRGETPLLVAAENNALDAVKLLVQRPELMYDVTNRRGQTAVEVAEEYGNTEIADFIRANMPKVPEV